MTYRPENRGQYSSAFIVSGEKGVRQGYYRRGKGSNNIPFGVATIVDYGSVRKHEGEQKTGLKEMKQS